MAVPNIFADRESGVLIKVTATDDSYVKVFVLNEQGLSHSMPRREYEQHFVERYRPARFEDITKQEAEIEYPANAADDPDWQNVLTDGVAVG